MEFVCMCAISQLSPLEPALHPTPDYNVNVIILELPAKASFSTALFHFLGKSYLYTISSGILFEAHTHALQRKNLSPKMWMNVYCLLVQNIRHSKYTLFLHKRSPSTYSREYVVNCSNGCTNLHYNPVLAIPVVCRHSLFPVSRVCARRLSSQLIFLMSLLLSLIRAFRCKNISTSGGESTR